MHKKYLYIIPAIIAISFYACSDRYLHTVKQVKDHNHQESLTKITDDGQQVVTVPASTVYSRGPLHKLLFGSHYRHTWAVPVEAPYFDITQENGGMIILQKSGSRQTMGLRLTDTSGQEWVLRSVDKNPASVLPEKMQRSWIAMIANDVTSSAHPYAAFTLPPMLAAAGIYHARPKLVYIPYDDALGEYRDEYGGMLALLEERPEDDESLKAHFGNAENIKNTGNMLHALLSDNDAMVEPRLFLRCRLMDILVGDWSRHEDNWRWAYYKTEEGEIFRPIPRDRDNVYFKFDGIVPKLSVKSGLRKHFRTFKPEIKNVSSLNKSGRPLDELLLTNLSRQDWIEIADSLKLLLTDDVIEEGVKQFPPEVFTLDGQVIMDYLRSRRDMLTEVAMEYFDDLVEYPLIVTTDKHEEVNITNLSDGSVRVVIYKIKKDQDRDKLIFDQTYSPKHTKKINIYTLAGEDVVKINFTGKAIPVYINGGAEADEYILSNTLAKKYIVLEDTGLGDNIDQKGKAKIILNENPEANSFDANGWLLRYYIWD